MQKYLLHPPLTIKQQYFSSICPQMFECEGGVDWEELTGWFVTVVFWSDADFVLILCKQFLCRKIQVLDFFLFSIFSWLLSLAGCASGRSGG